MGYTMLSGRWANTQERVLYVAAGAAESNAIETGASRVARIVAPVTVEGTDPSATVQVLGKQLPTDSWTVLASTESVVESATLRYAVQPMRYLALGVADVTGEDGGSVGAVVQTVGTGPGFTIELDGAASDTGSLVVEITTGGAPGTAEFSWDFGAEGDTEISIPTTPFEVTLDLGDTSVVLTFENDTFVLGDTFTVAVVESAADTVLTIPATVELA